MPSPILTSMPKSSTARARSRRIAVGSAAALSVLAVAGLLGACSSDSSPTAAAVTSAYSTAASVPGADNGHCGGKAPQAVSQAACHVEPTVPEGGTAEGEASDDDGMPDELPGMMGSEGDDDDCKYHVKWEATPVTTGGAVSIRATITSKVNQSPVSGAGPYLEIFLNDTPAASQGGDPVSGKGVENPAGSGVYTFDNVKFGKAGQWTFRVHIWGSCDDGEESPHGHAAFLINVP